jgi:hypothetical protein
MEVENEGEAQAEAKMKQLEQLQRDVHDPQLLEERRTKVRTQMTQLHAQLLAFYRVWDVAHSPEGEDHL